ncbi:MAG: hypothetical protein ACREU9_11100, partial [Gammaproteobacteria bacterium]
MPTPKVELKITARDDTRAAIQSVKQGLGSINGQLASLRSSALKIGAAFVGFRLAVAPILNFGRAAVNAADDLQTLFERTGISVEKLSAFAHAAKSANTDIQTVANGAKVLSVRMFDAARGSTKAAQLLDAFGVTAADTLESGLEKILAQLAAIPDAGTRSALAIKVLGSRAGAALAPFALGLKKGLEQARKFNIVISGETAAAADEFNESIAAVKASLSTGFVTALTPALQDLTRTLNDPKVQQSIQRLAAGAAGAVVAIGSNFDAIATAAAVLGTALAANFAVKGVAALGAWIVQAKAAAVSANALRASTLAGLQATAQAAAAEQVRTAALLRSAQAAAAAATASARMNAVLNSVLPAQRAAAAAAAANTA